MNARDELAQLLGNHESMGCGCCAYGTTTREQESAADSLDVSSYMVVLADAILAAGYRKPEPLWADTLTNDGKYEYTVSSDCDGSNVQYWRRIPGKTYVEAASPWEAYEPESASVLYEPEGK